MTSVGDESLPEPTLRRLGRREILQTVAGFAIALALLIFGMPMVVDTTWTQIGAQLSMVGWQASALMLGVMLAGLYCYTYTLIGSLPGLSHIRALMVNAAGSMVSNILPGGGAVGVAISYVMYRSWGFSRSNISTSLVVTGVWNILARVALPVLGMAVVVWGPVEAPTAIIVVSVLAGAAGTGLILLFALGIYSDRVSHVLGHLLTKLLRPFSSKIRAGINVERIIQDQRARMSTVVGKHSIKMTLGMVGMFGFFFVLYWVASRTVGLGLPVYMLFAAYAFRQFLTVIAITPGGLGITEVGTAGILVAFGGDPGAASAAALLYAIFANLLSVPLGLAAWGVWWFGPKNKARPKGQLRRNLVTTDTSSSPDPTGDPASHPATDSTTGQSQRPSS